MSLCVCNISIYAFFIDIESGFLLMFVQFPLTNGCMLTINNFLKINDL